jgi:hypothetical protein
LQEVDAVLGPQLGDGLAALLGVRFVSDRHVAVGQLLGVDHRVLLLSCGFVTPVLPTLPAMLRLGTLEGMAGQRPVC